MHLSSQPVALGWSRDRAGEPHDLLAQLGAALAFGLALHKFREEEVNRSAREPVDSEQLTTPARINPILAKVRPADGRAGQRTPRPEFYRWPTSVSAPATGRPASGSISMLMAPVASCGRGRDSAS